MLIEFIQETPFAADDWITEYRKIFTRLEVDDAHPAPDQTRESVVDDADKHEADTVKEVIYDVIEETRPLSI